MKAKLIPAIPQDSLQPPVSVSSPSNTSRPNQGSCANCRRRKVKCDKIYPCSNCTRNCTQCEFQVRKRAPRRSKKPDTTNDRETELLERLNTLEGMVKDLSGQVRSSQSNPTPLGPGDVPQTYFEPQIGSSSQTSTSVSSPPQIGGKERIEEEFGTLVIEEGKSQYTNDSFWAKLITEVHDIRNIVTNDVSEYEDGSSPDADSVKSPGADHQSFVLGYRSSSVDLHYLHPLPSQLGFYLQIFKQNVDPAVKLLHIPSLEHTLKNVQEGPESMSRATEALLFSVYFSVIYSMTPQEVQSNFRADKKSLIAQYSFAVEQALARARFLESFERVTLQAFVLYLFCSCCNDEIRAASVLSRTAIGIAQSLGLHRDGSLFKLSPFEAEMRRRLWWQLCILDVRIAEKQGVDASINFDLCDAKLPLNINDSDISPGSMVLPKERIGLTDTSFALAACEICMFIPNLRRQRLSLGSNTDIYSIIAEQERSLESLRQILQSKYIRYCTDESPLSMVISTAASLFLQKMQLVIWLPLTRSATPLPKKMADKIFTTSILIAKQRQELDSGKSKRWHWMLRSFTEWHAVAYLLGELCEREPDEHSNYAWMVLDQIFQDWKNSKTRGPPKILWLTMKKLLEKARMKRQADFGIEKKDKAAEAPIIQAMETSAGHLDFETFPAASINPQLLYFSAVAPHHSPQISSSMAVPPQESWFQQQNSLSEDSAVPWPLDDLSLQELGQNLEVVDGMEWDGLGTTTHDFSVFPAGNTAFNSREYNGSVIR